ARHIERSNEVHSSALLPGDGIADLELDQRSNESHAQSANDWSRKMTANMSFEDVLDELMMEERTPSYATLLRWQKRYPQYHEPLAEFFATWAIQTDHPKEAEIDEERLVEKGVSYAMRILRQQGRVIPKGAVESLQPFDQLALTAIYLLHGEGYSVNITEKISEMSGKPVLLASTFGSLNRLETLGLVSVWLADPATQ